MTSGPAPDQQGLSSSVLLCSVPLGINADEPRLAPRADQRIPESFVSGCSVASCLVQ